MDLLRRAFALLVLLAATGAVRAETFACTTLDTLPATIEAAGHYCLAADFAGDYGDVSGIMIQHPDVVLDCNGHRIRHTNPVNLSAHGVATGFNLPNITIRNCVLDGWHTGISVARDDLALGFARVAGNTVRNSRQQGINASGHNVTIEGNHVDHVLGNSPASGPVAIYLSNGSGFVVRNNTVSVIRPEITDSSGIAIGINLAGVHDSVIEDNVILGLTGYTGFGVYGILGANSTGLAVNRNVIASPPAPGTAPHDGEQYYAIFLQGTLEQQDTNVCRDNIAGHFNTNIAGCNQALNTAF